MWDAIEHLMPDQGRRPFTADEALAVEAILDAAAAYAADELPWWEAANVGAVASWKGMSTGYGRMLALLWAMANADPRLPALQLLIDDLIFQSGITITRFGIISVDELLQHHVTVKGAA